MLLSHFLRKAYFYANIHNFQLASKTTHHIENIPSTMSSSVTSSYSSESRLMVMKMRSIFPLVHSFFLLLIRQGNFQELFPQ